MNIFGFDIYRKAIAASVIYWEDMMFYLEKKN